MARPARVRMRSRNPWVFARRRLFGWNVRLLTEELPTQGPRHLDRWAGESSGMLAPPEGSDHLRYGRRPTTVKPGPPARRTLASRRHAEGRPHITGGLWRTACCRYAAAVSVRATGSSPAVRKGSARLSCPSVRFCFGRASSQSAMSVHMIHSLWTPMWTKARERSDFSLPQQLVHGEHSGVLVQGLAGIADV